MAILDESKTKDPYQVKKPAPAKPAPKPAPKKKPTPKKSTPAPSGGTTPAAPPPAAPETPAAPTPVPEQQPPPPTPPQDATGRYLFDSLAAWLRDMGLSDLFSTTADGTPTGWLWEKIQGGIDTTAELQVAVEGTDAWRSRFQAIVQQREAAARGEPVRVMSANEVIQYEQTAAQLLRSAGMPSWFYDSYQDFVPLMTGQVSVAELQSRIDRSLGMVTEAPPEVRDAFAEFYGANGDAALAAFFLDPNRTVSSLDRAARTAFTAGTARNFGLEVDKARAERIAQTPLSEAAIYQQLGDTAKLEPLSRSGFGEGSTLSDGQLLDATFFGDPAARREMERRLGMRQSTNSNSVGGALLTQRGVGVGTA